MKCDSVVYRAIKRLKYFQGTQRVNKHMVRTNTTTRQGSRDPLQVPRTAQIPNYVQYMLPLTCIDY